jgi:hypothetical protein
VLAALLAQLQQMAQMRWCWGELVRVMTWLGSAPAATAALAAAAVAVQYQLG